MLGLSFGRPIAKLISGTIPIPVQKCNDWEFIECLHFKLFQFHDGARIPQMTGQVIKNVVKVQSTFKIKRSKILKPFLLVFS